MTDSYPDYLNPFAEDLKLKSKPTIRDSFKGFKRSLRQSFRVKKKDEVTIREKSDTIIRRPTMSYHGPEIEALPRSRFRERLSKTQLNSDFRASNPFEEDESNNEIKPTMRRKAKKKAPLPPKSLSSQNINDERIEEVPASGSHWSLTSVETDYSGSTDYNNPEEPRTELRRESMAENFKDFNKNMEQLKDDTNNNIITKEEVKETESNNNIPDLVISCPNDTDRVKSAINEDSEEKEIVLSYTYDRERNTIESDANEDKETKEVAIECPNEKNGIKFETNENNVDKGDKKSLNESEDEENKSDGDTDSSNLIVTDITHNMIMEEDTNLKTDDELDAYLYHEKKSLYIAGSRDELADSNVESGTYTGTVSLYITGSCDDLDVTNNNQVVTDKNSNDDPVPIPKQRKNKLTKNNLLGM